MVFKMGSQTKRKLGIIGLILGIAITGNSIEHNIKNYNRNEKVQDNYKTLIQRHNPKETKNVKTYILMKNNENEIHKILREEYGQHYNKKLSECQEAKEDPLYSILQKYQNEITFLGQLEDVHKYCSEKIFGNNLNFFKEKIETIKLSIKKAKEPQKRKLEQRLQQTLAARKGTIGEKEANITEAYENINFNNELPWFIGGLGTMFSSSLLCYSSKHTQGALTQND